MEHLFQYPAGRKLQRAGEHHAAEEKQRDVVGKPAEHREHDHHAEAVDRAHGAVQEPAVDELARADRAEHDLHAPAQKRIDGKVPEQLVKCQNTRLPQVGFFLIIRSLTELVNIYNSKGESIQIIES